MDPLLIGFLEFAACLALLFYLLSRKDRTTLPLPVRFRCGVWGAAILSAGMALGHTSISLLGWCVCAGLTAYWCVWTVRHKVRAAEPFVSLLVPAALAGLLLSLR
ncbi:MAG: hypothetical protein Q3Y08_01345 [Butyricicoccus sp.]|nr:hypothetical protein [Butyricicoccus sp.]